MRLFSLGSAVAMAVSALGAPTPSKSGKIGYGSSTAVMSAAFQENVFQGFQLGLENTLGRQRAAEILEIRQIGDKSLQGATTSAEALIASGVVLLTGFPTSHDALLAADVARKAGVLGIFGGAGHTSLADKGPLVFTTGASMDALLTGLVEFVQKKFPGKRGMAVVNPYAVFSANQEALLKQRQASGTSGVNLNVRSVTQALTLHEADLKELKEGKYDYLYLTMYPDDSVALLSQLKTAQIDLPIIAWGGADPGILQRFVENMKSPCYIGTTWNPTNPKSRVVDKECKKRFGHGINSEVSIGYDLGTLVGRTIKGVDGPLTSESVKKSFFKQACFEGLTRGKFCFNPTGGHAAQKIEFLHFETAKQTGKKP